MRRLRLIVPLALIALAGCRGTDHTPLETLAAPASPQSGGCTQAYDQATVVRYLAQTDDRTQHSVHLLNASAASQRLVGCAEFLPLASVVTLSYRIAGS